MTNPNKHPLSGLLLASLMLLGNLLWAQAPEAINYQAIARDTSGQILAQQGLSISMGIYSGPLGDTLVYEEDHLLSTNAYGLFTLQIGSGTPVTGTFAGIDWEASDHFLETTIDAGNGPLNLGKKRFNSVPYALFSAQSGKAVKMGLDDLLDADTAGVLAGDVLKWDGVKWAPGIDIVATGQPGVNVTSRLSGDGTSLNPLDIAQNGATLNQVLKWDGTAWSPGNDAGTAYTAGTGIDITGTVISNTGDVDPSDDLVNSSAAGGDVSGTFFSMNVSGIQGTSVSSSAPANGQVLKFNSGTGQWEPGPDAGTTYTAGPGVNIVGTTISNTGDTNPSDDITVSTLAAGDLFGTYPAPQVVRIRGISVTPNTPLAGQVLKYDGVQWDVENDEINDADSDPGNEIQTLALVGSIITLSNGGGAVNLPTYVGGAGIGVTGTIISNTGDVNPNDDITTSTLAQGDLDGTYPDPTVVSIQNNPVASGVPNANDVMIWNGSNWEYQSVPDASPLNEIQTLNISGTTLTLSNGGGSVSLPYTGGAGISVSGTTIINTGDTDASDDITTSTAAAGDVSGTFPALTVGGLQGLPVAGITPATNQVLTWNGSQWIPAAPSSLWSQNASNLFYNSGNVSVGTNSSVSTLSVAGTSSVLDASNQIRVESGVQSGTGFVRTTGSNGTTNTVLSNRAGSEDNGFIAVYDSTGAVKAGIVVNSLGEGEIFGDSKSFRVAHPTQPDKEIWYASLEGPEAAAYLRGTATLKAGTAEIVFPEHFQLTIQEEGMTIMLTPLSADSKGLAVIAKSESGFTVKELLKGKGEYRFDWEVKSVRRGYQDFEVIRDELVVPED